MNDKNFADYLVAQIRQNQGLGSSMEALLHDIILDKGSPMDSFMAVIADHAGPRSDVAKELAIWSIGLSEKKRLGGKLLDVVLDPTQGQNVRQQAVLSIAQLSTKLLTSRLIKCLRAEDEFISISAAYALGWSFDKRAIIPLVDVLRNRTKKPTLRAQCAESLGNLEATAAVDALTECLYEDSIEIRFWCIFGLSHVGDRDVIPELERMLDDDRLLPGWRSVEAEAQLAIESILSRT